MHLVRGLTSADADPVLTLWWDVNVKFIEWEAKCDAYFF
jgi:hypothetical protein